MRRLIPAVAVVIAACGPQQAELTTTTEQDATTSTAVVTTTSLPMTTSTSAAPATTTTTIALATTTTELSGKWADLPLIATGIGALGWWDGAEWVAAEEEGALPVLGGEHYQVARIGLEATVVGGPQEFVCEPLFNLGIQLENADLLGQWPGPYGVAISAPWDLQPHLLEAFDDDGTYAAFASLLLGDRGLVVAAPVIKQLFRTDLEGDGVNEVLVVAEEITGGYLPTAGDYSIVFMRKVVQGDVQTAVLGESVITDPEGAFLVGFTIGAVSDLSGDGKMEIVVDSAYFEGLEIDVWEYVDDDLGLVSVLQTGCGS